MTTTIDHDARYHRAVRTLTRAVVDADLMGSYEQSVALLSLRYVLLDDRIAHDHVTPGLELTLWSFTEAERLVAEYRAEQAGGAA